MTSIRDVGRPTSALAPEPGPQGPDADLAGAPARYLKALWYLSAGEQAPTVGRLAERLGVSHPSASTTLKHLVASGYARRGTGNEIELTERGTQQAVRLVRRHRLVETFLAVVLNVSWDEVHEEAERLEWVLGDHLVDRIAQLLEEPERNPHGDPIPSAEGAFPELDDVPITSVPEGTKIRIMRVSSREPALLRYLSDEGLGVGTVVTVEGRTPYGPLWVTSSRGRHALGEPVAAAVSVAVVKSNARRKTAS